MDFEFLRLLVSGMTRDGRSGRNGMGRLTAGNKGCPYLGFWNFLFLVGGTLYVIDPVGFWFLFL